MRAVRAGIALVAATVAAIATVQLARVDAATGADRRLWQWDPVPVAQARTVLATRPVDGRAYRAIALAEHKPVLLDVANARWPRDALARASLADRALAAGDVDAGLSHLDALLRTHPSLSPTMLPLLLPHLGDARVRDALVERLAQDPPWRASLFALLRKDPAPAVETEALLAALARRVPPDDVALQTRVAALDRAGRPAEARALWMAALPEAERAEGALFDGGFEHPGVEGAYAWRFDDVPGAVIDYATDAAHAGASALSIEFDDRAVRFEAVRQALALAPGTYRLEAAALDRVDNARPFEWRIACRGSGAVLARLELPRESQWRKRSMNFEVPADCAAQTLVLVHSARSLEERRLHGRLLVDEVRIFPR